MASRNPLTRHMPRHLVDAAVRAQDHRCLYCRLPFGTVVYYPGHGNVTQSAVGDHFLPYAAGGRTTADNIVAACLICNSSKTGNLFQTVGLARDFIMDRRERKRIRVAFVPDTPITEDAERWAREYARWLSASLSAQDAEESS